MEQTFTGVSMISDRLGAVPLVLQLPIGSEAEFSGIVDILKMKRRCGNKILWEQNLKNK